MQFCHRCESEDKLARDSESAITYVACNQTATWPSPASSSGLHSKTSEICGSQVEIDLPPATQIIHCQRAKAAPTSPALGFHGLGRYQLLVIPFRWSLVLVMLRGIVVFVGRSSSHVALCFLESQRGDGTRTSERIESRR